MKATVLSLLTVSTIMLVGCHSYNFTLPENFQYAQRDTPLVRVRFSVNPTQELTGTMATEMFNMIDYYLRNTKRFVILLDNSNFKEECDLHVIATYKEHYKYGKNLSSYGAGITIQMKKDDQNIGDSSILAGGYSKGEKFRNSFIKPVQPDKYAHFKSALNRATFNFAEYLNKAYPVSSEISNFNLYEDTAHFLIPIGRNFGLRSDDDYLICFRTTEGFYHCVALAKCSPGAEESQLKVYAWNLDDPRVKRELLPRLKKNDKTLLTSGVMFAVARVKDKEN